MDREFTKSDDARQLDIGRERGDDARRDDAYALDYACRQDGRVGIILVGLYESMMAQIQNCMPNFFGPRA